MNAQDQTKLLFTILEDSFEAIVACNELGELNYFNKKAKIFFGSSELNLPVNISRMLNSALKGGVIKNEALMLVHDGASLHFVANAQSLVDSDGSIIGATLKLQEVTESKLASDMLYSRFHAIFEQAPFSIQILSKNGRALLVNSAYKNLWGISDELVQNYIYPTYNILEDKLLKDSEQYKYIERGFAGEIVQVPPFFYDPSKNGLPGRGRWAGGMIYPLKDANGILQEVVIIHRDVTDQYESTAEKEKLLEQLTLERNRLEAVIQHMPMGVLVAEAPDGKITVKNQRQLKMGRNLPPTKAITEVRKLKLCNADGIEYIHDNLPAIRSLKQGEVVNEEEVQAHYEDGIISTFAISSVPIKDSMGNVTSCVIITNDISEKKRAEGIQKFLAHVKSLLVTTLDYEKTIMDVANACLPFLADGCLIDLIIDDEIKRVFTQHHDPEIQLLMQKLQKLYPPRRNSPQPSCRVIESGKPEFLPQVDQTVIRSHCLNDEHGDLITKIGINSHIAIPLVIRGRVIGALNFMITSNRLPFDEIDLQTAFELGSHAAVAIDNARLYRDAQSAVQLRDDFISTASHELKTPITSMHLQIEVLASMIKSLEIEESKQAQIVMGKTKNQLERITRLIDDMLDISRISSGKLTVMKKPMDLELLAREVYERFTEQMKAQKIECSFDSSGPVLLEADPYRMEQVITNFLTNAIRYGNKTPIKVSVFKEHDRSILMVQDHGRGIAKIDQEKIFNRFERLASDVQGLGLGLFINREIILEHGGSITVKSDLGTGATFIVEI